MRPFQFKKPLNTGDFRNRIIIEQPVVIKDELNQVIETSWQELKKAWAMIKTVKGSEYIEASASQATRVYRFVIPYTSGITEEMRVKMNGRIFDIIEPPMNDDEMYQTLTIIAKEHV
ncbi:phage head closure protein [Bacillus mycoides]|uniref:phage head closure protein n=1 Tax=Bacillus mycoides TaxID=1405 RepID=UPI002E235FBF|nr:phage head closure protein [Bacillus mycoides]MED1629679.1 phage head closure protein [Bacillus mycoides]HDR7645396.1 phage head closure protein [Bacillus mycoides]